MSPPQPDLDNFSNKVARIRAQTEELEQHPEQSNILQELSTALEELDVAYEELAQQHNELLAARHALEQDRQHYLDLFESAPTGYLITDTYGVIRQINAAAAQLLGVLPDYLIGKPLAVYVAGDSRPAFREILFDLSITQHMKHVELKLQPRQDSPLEVALSVARFRTEVGEQTADELRWLLYDLTEHKKVEAAERDTIFAVTFQHAAVGIANVGLDGRWLRVNHKLCDLLGYTASELMQLTIQDVTYSDDMTVSTDAMKRLFSGYASQLSLEKRYIRKDGSVIWALVTSSVVPGFSGRPAYTISIIEDITERKRIETKEREQRALAEALQDTALSLTSTLNFDDVLVRVLTNTARVVPHDAAAILLIEKDTVSTARVRGYAEHGLKHLESDLSQWQVPISEVNLLQQMQASKEHILVSDWHDDGSFGKFTELSAIRSFIGIPLYSYDTLMGFLILHALTPDFFTTAHIAPLNAFAAQAAAAIQNAQLYQQAQLLAAADERQRLARDLHDSISQTLYASTVIAESLPRVNKSIPTSVTNYLNQLLDLNRAVMAEMRLLLLELRPDQLSKTNLAEQIRQLMTAVIGRRHIQLHLHIEDQKTPIPSEVHIALFRITQEAITNLTKHSRATEAEVFYVNDDSKVQIRVRDNGYGFDVSQPGSGMGLTNMPERAAAIGAEFRINSVKNQGTEVMVYWERESSA